MANEPYAPESYTPSEVAGELARARRTPTDEPLEIIELDVDGVIEHLYDLDRKDLRRVAYEALLIADGPDRIQGSTEDAAIAVYAGKLIEPTDGPDLLFTVWKK